MDENLKQAVERLHNCRASFVEDVLIVEKFEGETVWEGVVSVFDLEGHPKATRCYAWSHGLDSSKKRRFFAVLHQGPVKSSQDAVRAAIVNESRK